MIQRIGCGLLPAFHSRDNQSRVFVARSLTAFGVRQVRPDEVLFMYGGSYRPKGNRMQLIKVDRERRAAWPIPISARHLLPGALVCFLLPGALVFLMA